MPPLNVCFNYAEANCDLTGLKFPSIDANSGIFGHAVIPGPAKVESLRLFTSDFIGCQT